MLSATIVQCYYYDYYTVGVTTLLTNLLALSLIYKKSPEAMRIYKYCLMNFAICNIVHSIYVDFLLQPILVPEIRTSVMLGPLNRLPLSWGGPFYAIFTACFAWMIYSLMVSFVYIYASVVEDNISRYLQRGGWKLMTICTAFIFMAMVIAMYTILDKNESRMTMNFFRNEPNFYQFERFAMFIAFSPDADLPITCIIIAACIVIAGLFFLCFLCAFKTIRTLREKRGLMTPVTFRLQKQLTVTLIIQFIYPFVICIVPFAVELMYLALKWPYFLGDSETVTFIINSLIGTIPLFDATLKMVFIGPYRKAIVQVVKKCVRSNRIINKYFQN